MFRIRIQACKIGKITLCFEERSMAYPGAWCPFYKNKFKFFFITNLVKPGSRSGCGKMTGSGPDSVSLDPKQCKNPSLHGKLVEKIPHSSFSATFSDISIDYRLSNRGQYDENDNCCGSSIITHFIRIRIVLFCCQRIKSFAGKKIYYF